MPLRDFSGKKGLEYICNSQVSLAASPIASGWVEGRETSLTWGQSNTTVIGGSFI